MDTVFLLSYVDEKEDGDDLVLGIYKTRDAAKSAIKRFSLRPGFCDAPDRLVIDEYRLDEDEWKQGFVKV